MATGTVKLHRVLRAKPERIWRAFTEPQALSKWLPPYGFTCHVDKLDLKVGGKYHASFTNFGSGKSHAFGGEYREVVKNERLRYSDRFDDPNLPGEMDTTITLRANMAGTELTITQSGIPEAIPADMCYLGWQECLEQLAKLVEPEIPD